MRRFSMTMVAIGLGLGLSAGSAAAQQTITPTAGQSAEQLQADQAICINEAAAQSGYHPSASQSTADAGGPAVGGRARGAARGAAMGAVREGRTDADEREVEDLTDSAARVGAAAGGMRQRGDRREERRETQAAEANQAEQQARYQQVFSSCMTAKGYAVQ
jgi:hypothetical protein